MLEFTTLLHTRQSVENDFSSTHTSKMLKITSPLFTRRKSPPQYTGTVHTLRSFHTLVTLHTGLKTLTGLITIPGLCTFRISDAFLLAKWFLIRVFWARVIVWFHSSSTHGLTYLKDMLKMIIINFSWKLEFQRFKKCLYLALIIDRGSNKQTPGYPSITFRFFGMKNNKYWSCD